DSWEALAEMPTTHLHWPGVDVDAAALIFTSGSTGVPRGCTLSHHNIAFVVDAIQERLGYRFDDVVGCFLPLSFDYGLYQIFLAAQVGACLSIGDPDQVGPHLPRLLKEGEVTVLPAVPAVDAALIKMHGRRPYELPKLRSVTNTGERLPLAYIDRLREMFPGIEVFVMFGLTECKRVSILLPEEFDGGKKHTVGRPLKGTEVYAAGPEGERLPAGEVGELVVRGRHVALGYWRAPEETSMRFRKRAPHSAVELFTGDTGSVDEDGYITFASRADDLLKHRGNRISPVEIENEACGVTGVVEASVFKRESDDFLYLVVTTASEDLAEGDILRRLQERLEPAKVPDHVQIRKDMPKSVNGKIDRKALILETA
ncbi:MAG: AMP-binding protein, partial [Verrucomicrobiota bacterium]